LTGMTPLSIAAARIGFGMVALTLALQFTGQRLPRDLPTWRILVLAGLFNTTLPFLLIGWGQQHITAGRAAILLAAGPFVALTLSHFLTRDDRLTIAKIVGLMLGFGGVVVLIGFDALTGAADSLAGQAAVIAAAACYSVAGLLSRRLGHVPALANAAGVLITASLYMVPAALIVDRPWRFALDAETVLAVLFLGTVPTGIAYVLRFKLLLAVGLTFMTQVSYLIPLFAVFWAWLFLNEVPNLAGWFALALILMGIAVSRLRVPAWGGREIPGLPPAAPAPIIPQTPAGMGDSPDGARGRQ
ncbi:MAG: DMT family transporter, partial [Inquilinus sp.]|nr:DMT family transporter [Inquilinus sp.]